MTQVLLGLLALRDVEKSTDNLSDRAILILGKYAVTRKTPDPSAVLGLKTVLDLKNIIEAANNLFHMFGDPLPILGVKQFEEWRDSFPTGKRVTAVC